MKKVILTFLMLNSIHSQAINSDKVLSYIGFGSTAFMIYGLITSYNTLQTKYKKPDEQANERITFGTDDDMIISRSRMKKRIKTQMGFQTCLATVMGILAYKLYKKSI